MIFYSSSTSAHHYEDIIDIIHATQWTNVIVVCEDNHFCPADHFFSATLGKNHLQVVHYTLPDLANRSLIVEMFETQVSPSQQNWLLFCSYCTILVQEINKYEETHNLCGYLTYKYQWIFVSDREETLKELEDNVDQIMNLALVRLQPEMELYTAMFGKSRCFVKVYDDSMSSYIFPNRAYGLNDITLTLTVVPFMQSVWKYDNGTYDGYYIKLMDMFAQALNFTYHVIEPSDGKYGSYKDGEWSGMIRQLVDKKAHVAAHLSTNHERALHVDVMNAPVEYDYRAVVYHKPKPTSMSLSIFITPFTHYVWLSFAGIFILSVLTFQMSTSKRSSHFLSNIGFTNFIVMSTLNQGSTWSPSSQAARIIYSCYSLGLIILMSTYTAYLVSILAVKKDHIPFTTFMELADNNVYKFGTAVGSSADSDLHNNISVSPVYTKLQHKLNTDRINDPDVYTSSYSQLMDKVRNEKFAFFTTKSVYEDMVSESCELALLQELGQSIYVGFMFQKHSAYKELFDKVMLSIRKGKLDKSLQEIYWKKPRQCSDELSRAISVANIYGVFYLLLIGFSVAFLIMLSEILYHHIKGKCTGKIVCRIPQE